jgi:glycosyltransferase involved in cell wall biosynthesis
VVENGVETDLFAPSPETSDQSLRKELGAGGKFIVCYIGTLGMAHGLETLLTAAKQLQQNNPDVFFLVIGEGAEKERIKALAQSQGLSNIAFLDQQPREKIPSFISACDACLVLLKKTDVFKTVIPTKMLEFMSCARPVILGVEGQAQQIVEEAEAGLVIEPENAEALAEAIKLLAGNRELGRTLGRNGREHILRYRSRAGTAEDYLKVLDELVRSS